MEQLGLLQYHPIDILEDQLRAVHTDFEMYSTLTFLNDDDEQYRDVEDDDSNDDSSDDTEDADQGQCSYEPSPQKAKYPEKSLEEMKRVIDFENSGKMGRWKLSTVQKNFRWVRDKNHLDKIRRKVNNHGARYEKCEEMNDYVLGKFSEAVNNRCRIHDRDIKRWALSKKSKMGWTDFKASDTWVTRFKKRNRIAIRTITHIVSKASVENVEFIKAAAESFVQSIRLLVTQQYDSRPIIFNTDQSGFKKELHSGG